MHGADGKRGGRRVARGSEWGFKPRVLVLPEFTEEALFSRILAKCFSGRLVALQWGRQEAGWCFWRESGREARFPTLDFRCSETQGSISSDTGLLRHLCHCSHPAVPRDARSWADQLLTKSAPRSDGGTENSLLGGRKDPVSPPPHT